VTVLADTGAMYALMDRDDAWHERVRRWWERNREPVRLPVTVLPEIAWLARTRLGPRAEVAFARSVGDGELAVEPLDLDEDLERSADLMQAYGDAPLGFVDASLVAIAERLNVLALLTTDRRHFSMVRPRHAASFRLLP
jgi:predicted nucleic acid-binding protein